MKFKIGDRVRRLPNCGSFVWRRVMRSGHGNDIFFVKDIDRIGNLILGNDKIMLDSEYNPEYFEKVHKSFTL